MLELAVTGSSRGGEAEARSAFLGALTVTTGTSLPINRTVYEQRIYRNERVEGTRIYKQYFHFLRLRLLFLQGFALTPFESEPLPHSY